MPVIFVNRFGDAGRDGPAVALYGEVRRRVRVSPARPHRRRDDDWTPPGGASAIAIPTWAMIEARAA